MNSPQISIAMPVYNAAPFLEDALRSVFAQTFTDWELITAEDGSAAVGAVRCNQPDLILLDINFPPDVAHRGGVPWDGFLIIEWLRRIDAVKNIPIMVVSGADAAKFKTRALAAGAIHYFQKPIDNQQLLEAIARALGEAAPQSPEAKPVA
jgi:CheY-like chemotaxis protein